MDSARPWKYVNKRTYGKQKIEILLSRFLFVFFFKFYIRRSLHSSKLKKLKLIHMILELERGGKFSGEQ